MTATVHNQDTAGLHDDTHKARWRTFNEAQYVEYGRQSGEDHVSAKDLKGAQLTKNCDTKNSLIRHSSFNSTSFQCTTWAQGQPVPWEALATSLPPSPVETASHKSRDQSYRRVSIFGNGDASTDGLNENGSHSTQTSPEMSPRSVSLDSTTTAHKNLDDKFHYPRWKPFTSNSSIAVDIRAKPIKDTGNDFKLLLRLRKRVKLLRLQVQGQRAQVESKRVEQSDADENYIKWIRTRHVLNENPDHIQASEAKVLETLWKLCQTARDAYGPALDSLVSLESGLEVEEARLEQVEERIYGQPDGPKPQFPIMRSASDLDESISDSGDGNHSSERQSKASINTGQAHYNDYLWRLGNLDLLQERYQGLINERLALQNEREKRQRVGVDLSSEDLDFLAHFDENMEPLAKELAEVSADVERLKQLCIEKGLVNFDEIPGQTSPEDVTPNPEADQEKESELTAIHSKLSQYQERLGSNEPEFRASNNHGGFGPFINLWLLHKLQSSAMEILLLAYIVAATVGNMTASNWQEESLRLWWQDDTWNYVPENAYESNDRDSKLSELNGSPRSMGKQSK